MVITNLDGTTASVVSELTTVLPPATAYATSLLSTYKAVGYRPLQETNPPAPVNMETNYGTLGALGNAYYASSNATNVIFGQTGALALWVVGCVLVVTSFGWLIMIGIARRRGVH